MQIDISQAQSLCDGSTTFRLTLIKESIFGKVCVNGTVLNPLLPSDVWSVPDTPLLFVKGLLRSPHAVCKTSAICCRRTISARS